MVHNNCQVQRVVWLRFFLWHGYFFLIPSYTCLVGLVKASKTLAFVEEERTRRLAQARFSQRRDIGGMDVAVSAGC